ncbi:MAG: sodium:calcium antiporter [Fimbriimonadaceae bacterium]
MFNSLPLAIGVFVVATALIGVFGSRLTRVTDRLADATGLGEAFFGAVFLGGATSLPGIITSVTTAYQGYGQMAISNAIGGIAAQTSFLAIADITYRKANLEHAAASQSNLINGTLLATLLAMPVLAIAGPEFSVFGIHPITFAIPIVYYFGIRMVTKAKASPMWHPEQTAETKEDEPDEENLDIKTRFLWIKFAGFALITAGSGYMVARSGIFIADQTALSETLVGGLFTAVATSLPELVTTVAAVRQGALTLAVAVIIGGNCFDVLFVPFSDMAYRQGSIYHNIGEQELFIFALSILMTGTLILGMLRRVKHGVGNIGFESVTVIALYLGGFLIIAFGFGGS